MKSKILTSNPKLDEAIIKHMNINKDDSYNRFVDQTIEEMAELTKILIKERRGRDVQKDILQEMADVVICIECLLRGKGINLEEFDGYITNKLVKWMKNQKRNKA